MLMAAASAPVGALVRRRRPAGAGKEEERREQADERPSRIRQA